MVPSALCFPEQAPHPCGLLRAHTRSVLCSQQASLLIPHSPAVHQAITSHTKPRNISRAGGDLAPHGFRSPSQGPPPTLALQLLSRPATPC